MAQLLGGEEFFMGEIIPFIPQEAKHFTTYGATALNPESGLQIATSAGIFASNSKNEEDSGKISYLRKKKREVVGSKAFNLEYDTQPTDAELRDDVVSYLAEYRLRVQRFEYELDFSRNENGDGPLHLRDTHRGEPMRHKAQRAIEERELRGEAVHREIAEEQGLRSLEDQLNCTQGSIYWFSPPGPKDQGYGDYGFLFHGKATGNGADGMNLAMTAIRLEGANINQYANALSDLVGKDVGFTHADEFLRSPVVLSGEESSLRVDNLLQKHFSFQLNPEEREEHAWVLQKLSPAIDDFVHFVQYGTKDEKLTAFHALENYALKLQAEYREVKGSGGKIVFLDNNSEKRLADIVGQYGHEPPKAAGSCGSTENSNPLSSSSNVLGKMLNSGLRTALGLSEEGENFVCPKCKREASGPVGNQCPHCGLTKEEFAENGGVVC